MYEHVFQRLTEHTKEYSNEPKEYIRGEINWQSSRQVSEYLHFESWSMIVKNDAVFGKDKSSKDKNM